MVLLGSISISTSLAVFEPFALASVFCFVSVFVLHISLLLSDVLAMWVYSNSVWRTLPPNPITMLVHHTDVYSWLKSKGMVINLLLITQSSLSEELFEVRIFYPWLKVSDLCSLKYGDGIESHNKAGMSKVRSGGQMAPGLLFKIYYVWLTMQYWLVKQDHFACLLMSTVCRHAPNTNYAGGTNVIL